MRPANAPSQPRDQVMREVPTLAERGQYAEMLVRLQSVEGGMDDPDVLYAMGYAYYKMKNFGEAAHILERALRRGSQKASVLLPRVQKLVREADVEEVPLDGAEAMAAPDPKAQAIEHARQAAQHLQQAAADVAKSAKPVLQNVGHALQRQAVELQGMVKEKLDARKAAAAAIPGQPSPDAVELYPWDIPPVLMAKAAAYESSNNYRGFFCKCREVLHCVPKNEATGPGIKAEICVYPDMVGITGRPIGCLMQILLFLLSIPALLLAGPVYLIIGIVVLAVLAFCVVLLLSHPLLGILALIVLGGPLTIFFLLYFGLVAGWNNYIATLIRKDPKRPLAICLLYWKTPFIPRYWQQGDIAQVIRANIKRFLCGSRSLILFVQDSPMSDRPGCLDFAASRFPLCLSLARRRVFVTWLDKGSEEADIAAEAAAGVLGVPLIRAVSGKKGIKIP